MTKSPKPQTLPRSGGSYVREKSGKLKLSQKPTAPQPIGKAKAPKPDTDSTSEES